MKILMICFQYLNYHIFFNLGIKNDCLANKEFNLPNELKGDK